MILETHVDFEGWQFVSDKEAKFDGTRFDVCMSNAISPDLLLSLPAPEPPRHQIPAV